ncbi:TPA: Cro/CI family transcriptional regulator [Serratia odorifera]
MLKEKVVKHYGSQRAISAALGVSDSAVSQWGEVIPERVALKLSRITGGALTYDPSFYKKSTAPAA